MRQSHIGQGKIRIDENKINFGDVPRDTILTAKYVLRNIGDRDVRIINLMPDCSCTDYILKDTIVFRDSIVSLSLIFNTKGRSGHQEILATLETSSLDRFHLLRLECNITGLHSGQNVK